MGVYGKLLGYFRPLMRDIELLKMEPKIGAGFKDREIIKVFKGFVNYQRKRETEVSSGSIEYTEIPTLYTTEKLTQGNIINYDEVLYRIRAKNPHSFEGGYMAYRLESLTTWTDKEVETEGFSPVRGFT